MDFSAWFEAYLGGHWLTFDARHNRRRIGRVLIARGLDAADVPITMSFGKSSLLKFDIITEELDPRGIHGLADFPGLNSENKAIFQVDSASC